MEEIVGKADSLSGELIYGSPLTGTEDGVFTVDAVLVSDLGQVAVIDLAEGREAGEYRERQDRGFNLIARLLRMNQELMEGRRLRVHIQTLTFGPDLEARRTRRTRNTRWSRERPCWEPWNAARRSRRRGWTRTPFSRRC